MSDEALARARALGEMRKLLELDDALEAVRRIAVLMERHPLLHWAFREEVTTDRQKSLFEAAFALSEHWEFSDASDPSGVPASSVLHHMADVSPDDAENIFFDDLLPDSNRKRHFSQALYAYSTHVLPRTSGAGDEASRRLHSVNAAITRNFALRDEMRASLRCCLARALLEKGDMEGASAMAREYPSDILEASAGWAIFFDVARGSDDLSTVERALRAVMKLLERITPDARWPQLREAAAELLQSFSSSISGRGYTGDLAFAAPADDWKPEECLAALISARAAEDKMGHLVDLELFKEISEFVVAVSRWCSPYSDKEVSRIRELAADLRLRAITLQFKQLQATDKNPEDVAELAARLLDTIPMDALYDVKRSSVQEWLGQGWDELEDVSTTYLPRAEAVLDFLRRSGEPDLSPFIIEYSRALESELSAKAFTSFFAQVTPNLPPELVDAARNEKSTTKLARGAEGSLKLTLGDMVFIMGLCKPGGKTRRRVQLLDTFADYLETRFGPEVVEPEFAKRLEELRDLRNRAAHPHSTGEEDAETAMNGIREVLSTWLELYRRE